MDLYDNYFTVEGDNRKFDGGLEEENMMEYNISNNEVINFTSSAGFMERFSNQNAQYVDGPMDTGDWYLVTPSDVNDMKRESEEVSLGEHPSIYNKSLGFVERFAHQHGQYFEFPWIDEDCTEQSLVSVWLYTRPIGGRTDELISRRHWAIVFQWKGKSATYEGMNVDGYLQPRWHGGLPTDVGDMILEYIWRNDGTLGEHYLSPKQVNEAAKYNRANRYKYLAGNTNCHYWAKVFGESLGLKVPQTCEEAEPLNAMLASMYKLTS